MRKAWVIVILLLISFPVLLAAQQGGDDPSVETDWDYYSTDLYMAGDQSFIISLGVALPVLFIQNGGLIDPQFTPPVGGIGSLAYNYYLNPHFYVGAELNGFFIHTIQENTMFVIPLGIRAGTQLIAGPFEFPFTLTLGMIWHRYLDWTYFGLYAKAGVAAYFRATTQWSFGLVANWGWLPQWTNDSSRNVDGNFLDLMLSARYHF
ncbi:MAG: hypothetical protein FWB83_03245 [Treponema sp.]|nr:hypothetical protein [Treponema sp.]